MQSRHVPDSRGVHQIFRCYSRFNGRFNGRSVLKRNRQKSFGQEIGESDRSLIRHIPVLPRTDHKQISLQAVEHVPSYSLWTVRQFYLREIDTTMRLSGSQLCGAYDGHANARVDLSEFHLSIRIRSSTDPQKKTSRLEVRASNLKNGTYFTAKRFRFFVSKKTS